jgi:hypothetical protein
MILPRCRAVSLFAFACGGAFAAALAGCSSTVQMFEDSKESGIFSKPPEIFSAPDWAKVSGRGQGVSLGPSGPVALEELVGADGRCAPPVAEAPPPAAAPAPAENEKPAEAAAPPPPPADRPVGSIAGDLAGPPMPAGPPPAPPPPKRVASAAPEPMPGLQISSSQLAGGIALGMTECEAVRRAGPPNNVSIGANAKGERKVVLTYLTGSRPGIYTFDSGRLKEIDRAPAAPAPARATPKKKSKKTSLQAKTATKQQFERAYVQ